MKNYFISFILLSFSAITLAQDSLQTGYVKYKFKTKESAFTDKTIEVNTILDFNETESLYISFKTGIDSIANLGNYKFDESNLIVETASYDDKGFNIYRNFTTKEIVLNSRKIMTIPAYQVKDNWVEMKWNIINEFKEIAGHKVQKATTKFRGTDFEVWFTPDVPLPYGPIKLFGLPGVILEVWFKNEKQITAYEVCFPCENNNEIEPPIEKETLSIKDYVHLMDNLEYYLAIDVTKKNDHGGMLRMQKMPTEKDVWLRRQNGFEILFEWENEKTKRLVSEKELRKVLSPKKKEEKPKPANDLYFRPEPMNTNRY